MSDSEHEQDELLPFVRAADLDEPDVSRRWLVEGLWTRAGVGIIGGQAKIGKTWIGLDLALSVSSGTPCLGIYEVAEPGGALVYLAEDQLPMVRQRLEGLCRHRGLDVHDVPINVITAPTLRLDLERDRRRLLNTVQRVGPKLLLLDPMVRLHRRNENDAAEVSELLAYLRELQRACDVAIIVAHHMRKNGAGHAGQALRGSGDFHAWVDSALYLRRVRNRIVLRIEHRSAAPPEPIDLELVPHLDGDGAHFEVMSGARLPAVQEDTAPRPPLPDRVVEVLRHATVALTRAELRQQLRVNNQRLGEALSALEAEATVHRTANGWVRVPPKNGAT